MHETSIIQSLIELIREELAPQMPVRVARVRLRIGPLSGAEPAALRFAFDACAPDTLLSGARLEFALVPVTAWCRVCMTEREVQSPQKLVCPICNRPTPDLMGGKELELDWLEVIDTSEATHVH